MSSLDTVEGVTGVKKDVLDVDTSDEVLMRIAKQRETSYASYEGKIRKRQDTNYKYYTGRQEDNTAYDVTDGPITGNLLFEAAETFFPAAMAKNPSPVVWSDNSPEGNKLADDVKTMLQYHSDTLCIREHLTMMTRRWMVDMLGVLKYGWEKDIEDITVSVRDTKNFLFDPKGHVDVYGHFTGWTGERMTMTAEKLAERFPKHKDYITLLCEGKMGTDMTYTEWWDNDMYYCTLVNQVLDKGKNYFYNYGKDQENHFAKPIKPYTFLSVFSFGEEPYDVTGLIEQNIPNQNKYTRMLKQVDANIQNSNNGLAISADNFNQQTGKQAARARQIGHPILVPPGRPVSEAVVTLPAPGLPQSFFTAIDVTANNIRTIFGTNGITPQQPNEDTTARGMILNQQFDSSRIGGGVGEKIASVAEDAFNWFVQLYMVFYDEPHMASIIGSNKAQEFSIISSQSFGGHKLVVSVAPDSMKPKDELTQMNQAMELWSAGAIDPKSLLTILNFPDPQQTAEMAVLWKVAPQQYMQLNFPELMQQLQGQQPQQGATGQPQGAPGGAPQPIPPQGAPTTAETPPNASLANVPLPK